jgi:hypothetical protein
VKHLASDTRKGRTEGGIAKPGRFLVGQGGFATSTRGCEEEDDDGQSTV